MNFTDYALPGWIEDPDNYSLPPDIFSKTLIPEIQPIQIVTLVLYGLVVLLGVPGLFYLVMYCSVLQLVLISLDRLMLVKKPIWCQNKRRPREAVFGCVAVWCLALLGSIPQFIYARHREAGDVKRECVTGYPKGLVWFIASFHFIMGFIIPFLVIVVCHLMVYNSTQRGISRGRPRSKRTMKVIMAVVLSFFLCWLPLHLMDFIRLITPLSSIHSPKVYTAQTLALCLAYFNSCLNPLIYVCMGRNFKDSFSRSVRNILHFITEEPYSRASVANSDTKSTSSGKETTKI
ncbi:C5a anaphylatoxin chemotactic receptor 1 isoform X2 [Austrofundulus limnaeus]|uniref:C5a anaphylatoxin chemotactic receptor 1 isoform X2 n=1 Tax=Austrofundulus limnaeus TaxID=52670 RepID=A0A2I4BRZ9_AUSLI|nr:PREDICTED: C5a anaphylatoxin chemotactic receptor 1-like isoform X2 [Austrofundulus limnaeus]